VKERCILVVVGSLAFFLGGGREEEVAASSLGEAEGGGAGRFGLGVGFALGVRAEVEVEEEEEMRVLGSEAFVEGVRSFEVEEGEGTGPEVDASSFVEGC